MIKMFNDLNESVSWKARCMCDMSCCLGEKFVVVSLSTNIYIGSDSSLASLVLRLAEISMENVPFHETHRRNC